MLEILLVLVIIGAIAGFTARSLVPGSDPMGTIGTIGLGIVGAFVGSYLLRALMGVSVSAESLSVETIVGAIVGAIVVLLLYRAFAGGRRRSYSRR